MRTKENANSGKDVNFSILQEHVYNTAKMGPVILAQSVQEDTLPLSVGISVLLEDVKDEIKPVISDILLV